MSNLPPGIKPLQLLDGNGNEYERVLVPINGLRINVVFRAKDMEHIEDGRQMGRIIVAASEADAILMFKEMHPECEIIKTKIMGAAVRQQTDIENFKDG